MALGQIAEYIQHNAAVDLRAASHVLHRHGYSEPAKGPTFFRALFHEVTAADREAFTTIADLYEHLKENIRFEMRHEQGFTTSEDAAINFVRGTLHISMHPHEFPDHRPEAPLSGITSIIVIYEVTAPATSILFSMRGLNKLIETLPPSPGRDALDHSMNDVWDGYGADDEVVIDTANGCKIVGVTLYDTSDD